MKRRLVGIVAVFVLAATSAIGTDGRFEPPLPAGNRQAVPAGIPTCEEAQDGLRRRLLYIEGEIGIRSHQRSAWQAFGVAAQAAQHDFEPRCEQQSDTEGPENSIEVHTRPDRDISFRSHALQSFDCAAKELINVLTPPQRERFSETLWSFIRAARG